MVKESLGVLIVHGFTSSLDCVSEVEAAVRALGLPTRMPVLRGHGAESPEALRGVTWHDWVADARFAMQDLLTEVEQVVLFGHSMGGLVVLTLAADHREVVDGVVAAAAAIQLAAPIAPGRRLGFVAPLIVRLFKKWPMPPTYADPELAKYDTNYAWAPTDAISSLFEFSRVTRARLPEVRAPTLIMHSRKDTTVSPESVEIIYQGISTPEEQKRVAWFGVTEHEMFRDCETGPTVGTVLAWVRERAELAA
jgi:carboxylesterase